MLEHDGVSSFNFVSPVVVGAAGWIGYIASSVLFTLKVRINSKLVRIEENDGKNRQVDEDNEKIHQKELSLREVHELRKRHSSASVSVSYSNSGPLMIVGGSGSRLFDSSGKSYLDTRNNVCHCGHQNPHIVDRIQKQLGSLNTNSRYLHQNSALLAKRLTDLLPGPLDVVFFVNSGSEANDLALRLSRAHTKSKNTIVVDGAYHGHTLATLEISPYKFKKSREFSNLKVPDNGHTIPSPASHILTVPCPDTYRGRHKQSNDASQKYAAYVVEACNTFCQKSKDRKVGAFIMEGGMSVAGVVLPPSGYLHTCVKAVRDSGGIFIADEVQTGFGRLGSDLWAFQYGSSPDQPIIPDIVTVGKPFGNGMPLAAVITNREISRSFESMGVEYFNTFAGNPVCTAAGLAVLDVLQSKSLQKQAFLVGTYLKSKFYQLMEQIVIIGDVRGSGFFIGVELVCDRKTLEPASKETSFICTALKEKYSILTSIDGPHNNVLVIKPPMVFNKQDADEFVAGFKAVVLEDLANADLTEISITPT